MLLCQASDLVMVGKRPGNLAPLPCQGMVVGQAVLTLGILGAEIGLE